MAAVGDIRVPVKMELEYLSSWNWRYEVLHFASTFAAAFLAILLYKAVI